MTRPERLVVVGNGMVAARFVEELHARGGTERFAVTICGREPGGVYNRVLLSAVLAGRHAARDVITHPLPWFAERGVTVYAGARVVSLRLARREIHTDSFVQRWDRLVLATGSRPRVPRIDGARDACGDLVRGVHLLSTLEDCEAIAARAATARRAAVVGGGLLGLEAARALAERGLAVELVHVAPHLMDRQLDADAARMLRRSLESLGVCVHVGERPSRVVLDAGGEVAGLCFGRGRAVACEMVVIAAGSRPEAWLARAAGLRVGATGGVVVGDDLASPDDPRVHAIGACAEHRGSAYGFVAPLWEQARVLAERLAGRHPGARYTGSSPSAKLKARGLDVAVVGQGSAGDGDAVLEHVQPRRGVYRKVVVREGRVVSATLVGDVTSFAHLAQVHERNVPVPRERARLLAAGRSQVERLVAWAYGAPVNEE
ncbi:MAG TPA: FAD-dependent oxidoreductase [Polyangiaceae bacterium]|jgi:nitrite reductase (NADH) large subunit